MNVSASRNLKRKCSASAYTQCPRTRPTSKSNSPPSTEPASLESEASVSFSSQHPTAGTAPTCRRRHLALSGHPHDDTHDEASSPTTPTNDDEVEASEPEAFSFCSFPGELRNMIYSYSLHYPSSRDLYRRQLSTAYQPTSTWAPRLRTPTILLLSKHITRECLPILHARTLTIDRLPPARFGCEQPRELVRSYGGPRDPFEPNHFMLLSDFVTPATLQSVRRIEVNVGLCEGPLGSGWAWRSVVEELLRILARRNMCAQLRLLVRCCNTREDPVAWAADQPHLIWFQQSMEKFANDNPNVFAKREITLDVWKIEGHDATFVSSDSYPKLRKFFYDGNLVVVDEDGVVLDAPTRPESRRYPDKEMFPGSVMQFAKAVRTIHYGSDTDD